MANLTSVRSAASEARISSGDSPSSLAIYQLASYAESVSAGGAQSLTTLASIAGLVARARQGDPSAGTPLAASLLVDFLIDLAAGRSPSTDRLTGAIGAASSDISSGRDQRLATALLLLIAFVASGALSPVPVVTYLSTLIATNMASGNFNHNLAMSEAPQVVPFVDAGVPCAYVNPLGNAPTIGALAARFVAVSADSDVVIRVKLPPGVLSSTIRIAVLSDDFNNGFGSTSVALTSGWLETTLHATGMTPGVPYVAYFECNRGAPFTTVQAQALVESIKVVPVGATGIYASPFLYVDLYAMLCNAYPNRWGVDAAEQCVQLGSTLAWLEVSTDAVDGAIRYLCGAEVAGGFGSAVIDMNGQKQQLVTVGAGYGMANLATLPAGQKVLGVHNGYQLVDPISFDIAGLYIDALFLATTSVTAVPNQYSPKKTMFVGDSIITGFNATPGQSAAETLRYAKVTSPVMWSHGRLSLFEIGSTAPDRQASVNSMPTGIQGIYNQLGTNDFAGGTGASPWTAAAFGPAYLDFVRKQRAKYPGIPIWCQTLAPRTDQNTPNTQGDVASAYSAQIASSVATLRGEGDTLVFPIDGQAMYSLADLALDGVHLTTHGQEVVYAGNLTPIVG